MRIIYVDSRYILAPVPHLAKVGDNVPSSYGTAHAYFVTAVSCLCLYVTRMFHYSCFRTPEIGYNGAIGEAGIGGAFKSWS
jgi:hypothetical protein